MSSLEQSLHTLPECTCSLPVLIGFILHTRQLSVQCIATHCMSFCRFSFSHNIVPPSSIYGFWLPLWYFRTFLPTNMEQPQYKLQTICICKFFFFLFYCRDAVKKKLISSDSTFSTDKSMPSSNTSSTSLSNFGDLSTDGNSDVVNQQPTVIE